MVYFFLHVRLLGVFNPAVEEISGGHAEHFGDFSIVALLVLPRRMADCIELSSRPIFFASSRIVIFFLLRTVCVFF